MPGPCSKLELDGPSTHVSLTTIVPEVYVY